MLLKKNKTVLDKLGIITSVACAIHCTLIPLLLSSLPFLGINGLHNKAIEYGMIGLAFIFGLFSLVPGYKKRPLGRLSLLLFGAGFVFLLINQSTGERWLYFLVPAAATAIISAHILHLRSCRNNCKC
jgi:hypothetical protein